MSQVIAMIVDKFADTRAPGKALEGYGPVTKATAKQWLHIALRHILELFPSCQPILLRQLESRFPASDDTTEAHLEFVDNLLLVRSYTRIGRDIIELITTKCCELDIEMQLDLEDDTDDTVREIMQDLNAAKAAKEEAGGLDLQDDDEDDEENDDADSVLSDDSDLEEVTRLAQIRSKIQSMDSILDRLFEIYNQELADPSSTKAADCFEDILADFVNIILVRYKSRHSQFVIFWAAQKSPEFSSRFIGCLLDIITGDETRPALVKQTAVWFLAGFISRAAQVSAEEVRTVVSCLLDYIDYFRLKYEPNAQGPDITRYPVFYALFQGLLYTFCFRWRDLVIEEGSFVDRDDVMSYLNTDLCWLDGLEQRLKSCVHSKLNPLKVCAPAIVQEFARLSHALNLIYVYPRLELNKSISLSSFTFNAYATGGALRETGEQLHEDRWAPLQAEFPFDPYQLPISRRWLEKESLYITWSSLPDPCGRSGEDDSDTDEDEDDEDEIVGAEQLESSEYDS
jgi:RNA polymerase I-specific transcription initiation factor RRN3